MKLKHWAYILNVFAVVGLFFYIVIPTVCDAAVHAARPRESRTLTDSGIFLFYLIVGIRDNHILLTTLLALLAAQITYIIIERNNPDEELE